VPNYGETTRKSGFFLVQMLVYKYEKEDN